MADAYLRTGQRAPRGAAFAPAPRQVGAASIIGIALLGCLSCANAAPASEVSSPRAGQFTQNCQNSNPLLERLGSAIERGDLVALTAQHASPRSVPHALRIEQPIEDIVLVDEGQIEHGRQSATQRGLPATWQS
jgi:hypothetical protein